jgi:hypothetical protein
MYYRMTQPMVLLVQQQNSQCSPRNMARIGLNGSQTISVTLGTTPGVYAVNTVMWYPAKPVLR